MALIERIVGRLADAGVGVGSGDDAAFFPAPGAELLFTTDAMVEGVDFRLQYCSGEDVGWKAIAINASDIAAMGGRPAQAVATLILPSSTPPSFVDGVVSGMRDAAQRWGIALVGGDLSEGREMALSIALLGVPFGEAAVLRSGARAGDAICVTGSLGGAAGGLAVLERGLKRGVQQARALTARQLRPVARVDEAACLVAAGAGAMIDLSDGLAVDLGHLTQSSAVGCRIDESAIPVHRALAWLAKELDGELDPLTVAIIGGEDFELLFTIEAERVDAARASLAELGTPVTRIGTAAESERLIGERKLEDWRKQGWEHLRNR
jgi:thiamine-monophosphate kinase